MSVRRAQKEIDSREFAEWLAFDRIDPIGDQRQDMNTAMIVSTLLNVNRSKGPAVMPSDVMLDFAGTAQRKSPEEITAKLQAALGSKVVKHG